MRIPGRLLAIVVFVCVAGGGLAVAVPGRTFADKHAWLGRVRELGIYSALGEPGKTGKACIASKTSSTGTKQKKAQAKTLTAGSGAKGDGNAPAELRVVTGDRKAKQIEQAVLKVINETRAANGVPAVDWFEPVAEMARLKAREVLETGEFCHESKRYGYCTDMYDRAGLRYSAGDEISAGSDSMGSDIEALAKRLVRCWLNSPGHRRVLLGKQYKQVGVGVSYTNQPVEVTTKDVGGTAFGFSFTRPQVVEVDALFITLAPEGGSGR